MPPSDPTVRLTVAQAVLHYLANQHSVRDGERRRLIPAAFGIFGHGNVSGFGQAFDQLSDEMPVIQGRHEQYMAHAATAYAKAMRRTATLAVTASVGPGAMNLVTAAALATINKLPLLLLPGDVYATRRQGPVLQQLEDPTAGDLSVNDAFRPVSRFFDRITRPEQLQTALPQAMRALTNPVDTGAVVLSLPQDVQSHAFDFPVSFFEPRDWAIRRPIPDPSEVAESARRIRAAERPLIVAGGGTLFSGAETVLERLAERTGIPVAETFAGKGTIQSGSTTALLGGLGLEGTTAANAAAAEADLVIHVGTRLTDFATGSQTAFRDPEVQFVGINLHDYDAMKQGAHQVVGDARLALEALDDALGDHRTGAAWQERRDQLRAEWSTALRSSMDLAAPFDRAEHVRRTGVEVPETDAVLTQPQLIGLLQRTARVGDTIIAAAGGPPGDLLKSWDATGGQHAHLEFGFSTMGYEIPAAIGTRLATPDISRRVLSFIGDGTFVMAPSELVTACQEGLPLTVVVSENHGYQVINRLTMMKLGAEFGNEFRYREGADLLGATSEGRPAGRLEGDYLRIGLEDIARGTGAEVHRATTEHEVEAALGAARDASGPVVIVVPTVPHVDLPPAGAWWDVAPAEVAGDGWERLEPLREQYHEGLAHQRWHA